MSFDDLVERCRTDPDGLRREYQGNELRVYVPKRSMTTIKKRNRMIRQEFNGTNYRELQRRYGIKTRMLKVIIHRKGGAS